MPEAVTFTVVPRLTLTGVSPSQWSLPACRAGDGGGAAPLIMDRSEIECVCWT